MTNGMKPYGFGLRIDARAVRPQLEVVGRPRPRRSRRRGGSPFVPQRGRRASGARRTAARPMRHRACSGCRRARRGRRRRRPTRRRGPARRAPSRARGARPRPTSPCRRRRRGSPHRARCRSRAGRAGSRRRPRASARSAARARSCASARPSRRRRRGVDGEVQPGHEVRRGLVDDRLRVVEDEAAVVAPRSSAATARRRRTRGCRRSGGGGRRRALRSCSGSVVTSCVSSRWAQGLEDGGWRMEDGCDAAEAARLRLAPHSSRVRARSRASCRTRNTLRLDSP